MENFTRIDHEDGSIEYINNSITGSVTITQPIPEDIASLTSDQLQIKILESHKNFVRQERDRRLAECDWTQVADVPLTEEKKNEWILYRQSLRNLPSTIVDVSPINWPSKP
jgi:hypothetical protein